ncbi:hypothetical protein [uncultured Friedmanniella sp.]|uniref:hypothetical protein n=1 Tax=uncultured Friedmanniella sp. TaxID=335381 RepID=UPI0035CAA7F9
MSTELRPPASQHDPGAPAKKKIDLSFTQVMGGALAAMTAAFLGSRLSLAGTIGGAAVASIVAAVASNLYTASLQTTREKVRTVLRGRTDGSPAPVSGPPESGWDASSSEEPAGSPAGAAASPAGSPVAAPTGTALRRVRWRNVVLGALAAFALAAAVLTGLELASGQSLSGGKGTTITQAAEGGPAAPKTDPSGATSASPSSSVTDTPRAAEPSASASSEPSSEPSATEPAPSATPSATAAPSTGATPEPDTGDQPGADAGGQPGTEQGTG